MMLVPGPQLIHLRAPACERLISHTLSQDEVIPLIEAIFTSQDEVNMIDHLHGDNAQTFIDVVHEVRFPSLRSRDPV